MRKSTSNLPILAALAVAGFLAAGHAVAEDKPEESAKAVKKFGNYVFKPIEIKPSPHFFYYEGRFLFINKESSPVMIYGFDEPLGGKFEPRFLEFQILKDGKWEKLPSGYCGTGAQDFPMLPGKEYEFVTSLVNFKEQDTPLTGKIGVNGCWSEPFVLDWKKDRSAGKFEQARKENFEKARALFAKAGFREELLAGDDFCSRLLEAMIKEASAKDVEDSFPAFAGKLEVFPAIQLNGSIMIEFESDKPEGFPREFSGHFVLDPVKFSPEWYREAVKRDVSVWKREDSMKMELDDGSNFDSPFYLSIIYEPFDKTKRPSKEDAKKVFRTMLGVLDGWLK
jgi:hypothetical protein